MIDIFRILSQNRYHKAEIQSQARDHLVLASGQKADKTRDGFVLAFSNDKIQSIAGYERN